MDGVGGYIGGDTPHVWSLADWNSQHVRFRLPIFVRSNPAGASAAGDVGAALTQLRALGAPSGILVAWDMETAADAAYIKAVYNLITADGYKLIVYGSQSSVFGNDNPDGLYWGAEWTSVSGLKPGDAITQFVSFNSYDVDTAEATLPYWDTSGPPNPYPTIQSGTTGTPVKTAQTRLNAWRTFITPSFIPALAVDGVFAALTEAAVKDFQTASKLTVDGIVGSVTWAALNKTPVKTPATPPEPTYGPPLNLRAIGGKTSVKLSWDAPAPVTGLPPASQYTVFVYRGVTGASVHTIEPSYPRNVGNVKVYQGGSLQRRSTYTAHVVASGPDFTHVGAFVYASVTFETS
jgi:peptidoglycan hydrolase-like protein with peptidoglycan-binding domain